MSLRYPNGAVIKPGFNPVLVPGAPSIGLVTGGNAQVIVAFTAPTDTGGSAITSYQVVSSPGSVIATGASSPITVTGLSNGTAYTFRVAAVNSYGAGTFSASSASVTPTNAGQQAYTTAGTYTWVAPACITSVSVVTVGGGGNTGFVPTGGYPAGGGGALAYANNISVTPGNSYTVIVGAGGGVFGASGGNSSFNGTTVRAGGGETNNSCTYTRALGGVVLNGTGGAGGAGGSDPLLGTQAGAGGAGGYSGAGGRGGDSNNFSNATNGSGGGGGGGNASNSAGGGVGILGEGTSGTAGNPGNPGSGGSGTLYGGGKGGVGAVRVIWPGTTRQFPSTNTGNL